MKKSRLQNIVSEEIDRVIEQEIGLHAISLLEGKTSTGFMDREKVVGYRWKDFKKNYLKLNPKYKIVSKDGIEYGFKSGTKTAHWKYYIEDGEVYLDDKMTARKVMTGKADKRIFEGKINEAPQVAPQKRMEFGVEYRDSKGKPKKDNPLIKRFKNKAQADRFAKKGNQIDKVGGKYTVVQVPIQESADQSHKLTEAKFYVSYNPGRGMGKKVVNSRESDYEDPRVFRNYNDAEKYVKKVKSSGASAGRIISYWVSDINSNRIDKRGKVKEAKLSTIHKAAKKGNYPATIVVIEKNKVIYQELVKTPQVVPAVFNILQKKYPNAKISIESKTGEVLFTEAVSPKEGARRLVDKLVQTKLLDKKNEKKAIDLLTYLMARGVHEGKLNEAVKLDKGDTIGTSLRYTFDKKGQDIAMKWLKKNKVRNVLNTLKDKYSDSAVINIDGRKYTLYAHYGQLRIGGGGKLGNTWRKGDEVDLLKQMQENKHVWIKPITEATSLWKMFDAKMKLQDEIMDLEYDMKMDTKAIRQLHKDMEQEAEPEGGKVADKYGKQIDKLEKSYKKKKSEFKKLMAKLDKMEQY